MKKRGCIPNPFIEQNFELINSSQTLHQICGKSETNSMVKKICEKNCVKNCKQDSYVSYLANHKISHNLEKIMSINRTNIQESTYSAQENESFIEFLSNIGGLFGLWFGMSFIDMSQLIETIAVYFRRYLNIIKKWKLFRLLKTKLIKFILIFENILIKIKNYNWSRIITFLTLPVLSYQAFLLITQYLRFTYYVSHEFQDYKLIDGKISINEYPAITLCNDNRFEELFFGETRNRNNFGVDSNKSIPKFTSTNHEIQSFLTSYNRVDGRGGKFLYENFDIDNQDQFKAVMYDLENKNKSLNGTLDLFKFYGNHYLCETMEQNIDCDQLKPRIKILSPFGKCHTFLWGNHLSDNFSTNTIILSESFSNDVPLDYSYYCAYYLTRQMFFHPPNSFSIMGENEAFFKDIFQFFNCTDVSTKSFISKHQYNRLPKPFETNCFEYENSTRFDCINKCYFDGYIKRFDCIPNSDNLYTVLIENKLGFNFCSPSLQSNISDFNLILSEKCDQMCGDSCLHISYDITFTEKILFDRYKHEFTLETNFFKFIYHAKLTIRELIIEITCILSFWHGTSYIQLASYIYLNLKKYSNKIRLVEKVYKIF